MSKIRLNLQELTVESFNTAVHATPSGGTVHAHATQDSVCTRRILPGGDSNYDPGCQEGYTNDEPSCNNLTCYYSCMGSCDTACPTEADYFTCWQDAITECGGHC